MSNEDIESNKLSLKETRKKAKKPYLSIAVYRQGKQKCNPEKIAQSPSHPDCYYPTS